MTVSLSTEIHDERTLMRVRTVMVIAVWIEHTQECRTIDHFLTKCIAVIPRATCEGPPMAVLPSVASAALVHHFLPSIFDAPADGPQAVEPLALAQLRNLHEEIQNAHQDFEI